MPPTGDKGKVLIIEDDPLVRDLLSQTLSDVGGYETDVAVDGQDGLDKIREADFDVVFTDLNMPRLNGMEFLKRSKTVRPATPVVVITGVSGMEIAINAMREGASDFIPKPFKVDKIISTMDRILGEKKLLGRIIESAGSTGSMERLNAELFKRLQEIVTLHSMSTDIDGQLDNKDIYGRIAGMAAKLLTTNEVSFGILEDGRLDIKSAIGALSAPVSVAGTLLEEVAGRARYRIADVGEPNPVTGIPLASQYLAIPLVVGNETFGILSLSNKADGTAFSEDEIYLAINFARKAASKIENNALYEVFFNNLVDTLMSLVATVEARDSYTKQHSERVTMYALRIAAAMELGAEEMDLIRFGGFLHDIGKIGVRDTVLLKPGGLSREEIEEIRRHAVIGDEIVKPIKFFTREREIIRHHHEHYNGAGYPDGLAGDKIPLIARILTVADSYDAMTSNRPYRNARSHGYAVSELNRCASTQFDPEVVRAFLSTRIGEEGAS